MKTPPFITSFSIIFWGWQNGLTAVALCMVFLVESRYIYRQRWAFQEKDFNRISDFSLAILLGSILYNLISDPHRLIYITLKWLPLIVFPILLSQLYSLQGKIDVRSIMPFARKNKLRRLRDIHDINIAWPYITICLTGAGVANHRGFIYYMVLFLISLPALYPNRSKRYSPFVWFAAIGIAASVGWVGQAGMYRLQEVITELTINYLVKKGINPSENYTEIGKIRKLKNSGKILLRVDSPSAGSLLLKETTYNILQGHRWYASLSGFTDIRPEGKGEDWTISKKNTGKTEKHIKLFCNIKENKKILPIPNGTCRIENLPVNTLEKNRLGAVKAGGGNGFSSPGVFFNDESWDRSPDSADFEIPENEKKVINLFIEELKAELGDNVGALPLSDKLALIKKYFSSHFQYSLDPGTDKAGEGSGLDQFLLHTRKGHCELYAAATVLLLRAAGIPARYATGYLMHEYSSYEKLFIVRERDAHAWVLIWNEGRWENYDTTPPDWNSVSSLKKTQFLSDLLSFLSFRFSLWRHGLTHEKIRNLTLCIFLPLILYLLWRLRSGGKIISVKADSPAFFKKHIQPLAGFYQLEEFLSKLGYGRYPYETFGMWIKRIEQSGLTGNHAETEQVLLLHYRDMYGDTPLNRKEIRCIQSHIEQLLSNSESLYH